MGHLYLDVASVPLSFIIQKCGRKPHRKEDAIHGVMLLRWFVFRVCDMRSIIQSHFWSTPARLKSESACNIHQLLEYQSALSHLRVPLPATRRTHNARIRDKSVEEANKNALQISTQLKKSFV